jgi:uncharacterized membrane protein
MMYSDGCGLLESRPQEGGHTVRRTTLLMLALMAAVLLAASGAALAKNITGTDTGQTKTISNTVVGVMMLSTVKVASGTWSMAAEASTPAMWTPRTG